MSFCGGGSVFQELGGGAVLLVVGEQVLIVLQRQNDLFLNAVVVTVGIQAVEVAEDVGIVLGCDHQVELLVGNHEVSLDKVQGDAGESGCLLEVGVVKIAVGRHICHGTAGLGLPVAECFALGQGQLQIGNGFLFGGAGFSSAAGFVGSGRLGLLGRCLFCGSGCRLAFGCLGSGCRGSGAAAASHNRQDQRHGKQQRKAAFQVFHVLFSFHH